MTQFLKLPLIQRSLLVMCLLVAVPSFAVVVSPVSFDLHNTLSKKAPIPYDNLEDFKVKFKERLIKIASRVLLQDFANNVKFWGKKIQNKHQIFTMISNAQIEFVDDLGMYNDSLVDLKVYKEILDNPDTEDVNEYQPVLIKIDKGQLGFILSRGWPDGLLLHEVTRMFGVGKDDYTKFNTLPSIDGCRSVMQKVIHRIKGLYVYDFYNNADKDKILSEPIQYLSQIKSAYFYSGAPYNNSQREELFYSPNYKHLQNIMYSVSAAATMDAFQNSLPEYIKSMNLLSELEIGRGPNLYVLLEELKKHHSEVNTLKFNSFVQKLVQRIVKEDLFCQHNPQDGVINVWTPRDVFDWMSKEIERI